MTEPYWAKWSTEDKQRCTAYDCKHLNGDHSIYGDNHCLQSRCNCDQFQPTLCTVCDQVIELRDTASDGVPFWCHTEDQRDADPPHTPEPTTTFTGRTVTDEWIPAKAQAAVRAQGMCGELLHGDRDVCILEPGHGQHGTVQDIARAYYEATDWSGCAGSGWDNLPTEARVTYIRQINTWVKAIDAAGARIVRK